MKNEKEYLLVCLMEECGEIIQAASKCLRHGENNHHPDREDNTNWGELLKEIQDFQSIRNMLGISVSTSFEKIDRVKSFMIKHIWDEKNDN